MNDDYAEDIDVESVVDLVKEMTYEERELFFSLIDPLRSK